MSTLGIYPEYIDPEILLFQWPDRTKMHSIYQSLLKEGNGNHNCFRGTHIFDNKFEVLRSGI